MVAYTTGIMRTLVQAVLVPPCLSMSHDRPTHMCRNAGLHKAYSVWVISENSDVTEVPTIDTKMIGNIHPTVEP
jgi:hypothetical protein